MCDVLGDQPQSWSHHAPLPVPIWYHEQLSLFSEAASSASVGDIAGAINILAQVRSDDLRAWFVEHGQISGRFRTRILRVPRPETKSIARDPLRSPDSFAHDVLKRDGYRCRYCKLAVIPKAILSAFEKVVGSDVFKSTGTNAQRHGVVLAFRANIDHVIPWKYGGQTNMENLVTACWACNYGKASYTIEELMIDDPRDFPPRVDAWQGLEALLQGLRRHAAVGGPCLF